MGRVPSTILRKSARINENWPTSGIIYFVTMEEWFSADAPDASKAAFTSGDM